MSTEKSVTNFTKDQVINKDYNHVRVIQTLNVFQSQLHLIAHIVFNSIVSHEIIS